MKKEILTNKLFHELVNAASLASSADNMQPWVFRKSKDSIEVFCAKSRLLPTDIYNMFTWISIGAAIQNIIISAQANKLISFIHFNPLINMDNYIARIRFLNGDIYNYLEKWLAKRKTNRNPYLTKPLDENNISKLTKSILEFNANIYWTTSNSDLDIIASLDANSSYIRLEHKPFHDELFDILRFTKKEMEELRYGLNFESLGVPASASLIARYLSNWKINKTISKLGLGRLVAKNLAVKLRKTGAICLLTVPNNDPKSYIEAGRAMQQLWLTAAAEGLSVQPYGVLPQYITRLNHEPKSFNTKHAMIMRKNKEIFYNIFPKAENEYPAIVLRIGKTNKVPLKNNIRIYTNELIMN